MKLHPEKLGFVHYTTRKRVHVRFARLDQKEHSRSLRKPPDECIVDNEVFESTNLYPFMIAGRRRISLDPQKVKVLVHCLLYTIC
jgi:hypothetical protein